MGGINRFLRHTAAAGVGLAALLTSGPAMAQTEDAPPRLTFDFLGTLSDDTNNSLSITDPDPGGRLDLRLGLTFNSKTQLQQLMISGSGLLRYGVQGDAPERQGVFQQPRLLLEYDRDTGNSNLSVTASYILSDVNSPYAQNLTDNTGGSSVPPTGNVTDSAAGVRLETGVNDTVGFIFSLDATDRAYSDTSNPGTYDTATKSAGFTTRFTPSEVTQVSLNFGYDNEVNSDTANTERNDGEVSLQLDQQLNPTLTLQAVLGYSNNETNQTIDGAPVSEISDGGFGQAGLTLDMPNGTASINYAADRDSAGIRNVLSIGRDLELPGGATFAADIGVSERIGYDPQLVGSINYEAVLPRSSFLATLDRYVELDTNNADVAYTRFGVAYTHDITAISDFGLSVDVTASGETDFGTASLEERQTLRATYGHDISQDWRLLAGYQYRHLYYEDDGDAWSNSIFVTFGRNFVLRP